MVSVFGSPLQAKGTSGARSHHSASLSELDITSIVKVGRRHLFKDMGPRST